MDRYEVRRAALKRLVDSLGRGGRAEVARAINREASYVSRMLYPPGKDGRKRMGEDLVELLTKAYPQWLDPAAEAPASTTTLPAAAARARVETAARAGYVRIAAPPGAGSVLACIEMSAAEVTRRIGFTPEPGRLQLHAHTGPAMRPVLDDGDGVLVDTAVRAFAGDAHYLVGSGADAQVKLLQRRGAEVWVVSHNGDFPAWPADPATLEVSGRVLLRATLHPM